MSKKTVKQQNDGGMAATKGGSRLWGLFWLLMLIIVDQVTKLIADVYFNETVSAQGLPDRIALVPGMLELCISYNRGIAFSSFANADSWIKMAIVGGTALVMFILLIVFLKIDKRRAWLRVALVLIIAGGLGNFIDRVYYQVWDPATDMAIRDGVRDMVYLNVFINFGVCNFADFFICIGAAIFVVGMLFFDTDALIPLGKYKAYAKAADEKAEEKRELKAAAKAAKAAQRRQRKQK